MFGGANRGHAKAGRQALIHTHAHAHAHTHKNARTHAHSHWHMVRVFLRAFHVLGGIGFDVSDFLTHGSKQPSLSIEDFLDEW